MSKESIRASIARKKDQVALCRTEIAQLRSRKKTATSQSSKVHYESSIRTKLSRIASLQREIVSLRARLKTAK